MRILSERQRPLSFYQSLPSFTQQWDMIASILEANPQIEQAVWDDLTSDKKGGRKKRRAPPGPKPYSGNPVTGLAESWVQAIALQTEAYVPALLGNDRAGFLFWKTIARRGMLVTVN
jgi:hypothetical protein